MLVVRPPIDGGTIVVTGASGGIGRELAVQLAGRAGCVAVVAPTVERLEGLRDELAAHPQLRVVVVSADLSDQAEVERALATIGAEVGEVDVLVNNAGVVATGLAERASPQVGRLRNQATQGRPHGTFRARPLGYHRAVWGRWARSRVAVSTLGTARTFCVTIRY